MRGVAGVAGLALCAVLVTPSCAGDLSVAFEAGTEREPGDFSHAVLNYDNATIVQTYGSGLSLIGFLQSSRPHDADAVWSVEAMAGYRWPIASSMSIYCSAGAGERMSAARSFAYLTMRGGVDQALGEKWTWNVLNLRYRNGIDSGTTYRASIAGTGLTYRLDEDFALYARVFAAFDTEFHFAGTGIGIGARRYF